MRGETRHLLDEKEKDWHVADGAATPYITM